MKNNLKNLLNLSENEIEEFAGYPDEVIDYALNATLRRSKENHHVKYFRGVVQNYCMRNGIFKSVPETVPSVPEKDFSHMGKEEGIYKPVYPGKPKGKMASSSREQMLRYAYPHLKSGEYDEIKETQRNLMNFLSLVKDKEEIKDIKSQLFDLSLRLTNRL